MVADRRSVLRGALAIAASAMLPTASTTVARPIPIAKTIPSTGESLPAVGLGSWITFNVGSDPVLLDDCAAAISAFVANGGRMIDSSPMYGSSQATIGYGLRKLANPSKVFSADKVWTWDDGAGPAQIEQSRTRWGIARFDLLQVHNVVSWQAHLETLFAMKAADRLRYVGITTSHGRRHSELAAIMASQPIDFVQLTYNPVDRAAERRILPLAQERGIAVIANRPFQGGSLVDGLARYRLPGWASQAGAASWAQLILKFIISHPAVTCAIPATTRVDHVRENVAAATELLHDDTLRQRIAEHIRAL